MFNRSDLKQRAKIVLRRDYWKAFLISLVIGAAVGGGMGSGSSYRLSNRNSSNSNFKGMTLTNIDWSAVLLVLIIALFIFAVVLIFAFAIRIFIGYPLEVGGRRYFIKTDMEMDNRLCFTFAFQSKNYFKIVLSMLLRNVQIFLWTLLFIIPGIIKSYEYYFVPYILAENPQIGPKQAISLSRKMTYGNKFEIFILELSFIGWYLLGVLACCVGVLFVRPYIDMTMAELYVDLRKNAMEKGICQASDFGIEIVDPEI